MLASIGRQFAMLTVSVRVFAVHWNRHLVLQIKSPNYEDWIELSNNILFVQ